MNATRLTMWVVAAAAAVGITTAAVTVANASSGRDDVLSQDDVSRELAGETNPATQPSQPDNQQPAPDGEVSTFERTPGRVVVMCDGDQAWLVSWSPNPGYRVDDVVRGPGTQVSVWFESDSFDDVEVVVTCEGGQAVATDLVEPDDHGDDRDRGDDNGDGDDNSGPGDGSGDDDNSGPGDGSGDDDNSGPGDGSDDDEDRSGSNSGSG
jgi:hypothetical protein